MGSRRAVLSNAPPPPPHFGGEGMWPEKTVTSPGPHGGGVGAGLLLLSQ